MHSLTKELQTRTVDQFIKALDPSKTILLEADVKSIKEEVSKIFATMAKGNCSAIENAYELVLTRVKENESYVRQTMDDKYKLDENIEITTDQDKRQFPKTLDEKKELLKKMIHFQRVFYLGWRGPHVGLAPKNLLN